MKTPSKKLAKMFPIGSEFQFPSTQPHPTKPIGTMMTFYVKSCGDIGLDKTNEWDQMCFGRHVCFGSEKQDDQVFGLIIKYSFEQAWRLHKGMKALQVSTSNRRRNKKK